MVVYFLHVKSFPRCNSSGPCLLGSIALKRFYFLNLLSLLLKDITIKLIFPLPVIIFHLDERVIVGKFRILLKFLLFAHIGISFVEYVFAWLDG